MADLNRRQLLKSLAAAGVAASIPWGQVRAQGMGDRKFLIVVAAAGGASIIDGPLAIRESESANGQVINAFPDQLVEQVGAFRAIDMNLSQVGPIPFPVQTRQIEFVRRHHNDMMVATLSGTSVNHKIAQKRSLTGNDAWGGRTLQEAVAAQWGSDLPLSNVNMSIDGYIEPGIDPTLPTHANAELVADARLWFASLHGSKGLGAGLPSQSLIERARHLRDTELEPATAFVRTFGKSPALRRWWQSRGESLPAFEQANLIQKLNILPERQGFPLAEYGLLAAEDADRLRAVFPNFFDDPLEAQAALAFLLIKNGVSNTVTIGPSFQPIVGAGSISSTPLAFDFSHSSHRAGQGLMWSRVLDVIDRLIRLLKEEEYGNDGGSYWDRSMVYIATEFGRSKKRPAGSTEFGTAHNINNGVLLISPMVNGNTVLGGVDPDTGLTYGFDPRTGDPEPGRTMTEAEIYAGITQALGVDTTGSGLPDMPAMSR